MSAVAIVAGGILRKMTGSPIAAGIKLYRALATQFTVVLISDELEDKATLAYWLETEGLQEHARVEWSDIVLDQFPDPQRRLMQVVNISRVNSVELVLEPDPLVSAELIKEGWNTLTVSYAAYMLPSWRPDWVGTVEPWNELSKQVADAARLRAMDKSMES